MLPRSQLFMHLDLNRNYWRVSVCVDFTKCNQLIRLSVMKFSVMRVSEGGLEAVSALSSLLLLEHPIVTDVC